jgi:signal transduction histidine kinase/DNA-binding NarL/FixJ family response regulator
VTIHRTDTFCDSVLANIAPLVVLDADAEPYAQLPGKQIVGTKSYIGVPIVLNDSRLFGTLCAHDRRALSLGEGEINFLLVLARFVASHIEREEALHIQEQTARRLAIRNAELGAANQQLVVLNDLADSIAAHLDLRSLLGTIVASAVQLLGASGGAISLLGENLDSPRLLTATYNLPESIGLESIPGRAGLMGQVVAARGPVIVDRYSKLDVPLGHSFFHELAPWIAVPIWSGEEITGTFGIGANDPERVFNERDVEMLVHLAKHAAVAIENARLYAASRDLGAAEERNRLAAEIHDTLAQSLLALTFQLRTARGLISSSPDRATLELQEAEQRTREALDEARRSVWNLGPASLEAGTLVEALQGELSASERNGLPGRLTVSGSPRPLHAETQLAIFRIAQESLANARKHARATDVEIMLEFGVNGVTLTVADNGIGFDPAAARQSSPREEGGYGIVSMSDRMERVSGTLKIKSGPDQAGTKVIASAPYEPIVRISQPPATPIAESKSIRVLVADDHPATRAGLASILSQQEGITVVATAANGEEALALVETLLPDVLVIDLRMPKLSGVETIARLSKLGLSTRAVAVTTFAQDELVFQAMRAGARGYLLKDASADELANAVRVINDGGTYLAQVVAGKLAGGLASNERLTARERQVLELLAQGRSDKEVAGELNTSVKTASFHVANVISKLGAQNRAEAVRLAYERGHFPE